MIKKWSIRYPAVGGEEERLSLIHISEPTRRS